VSWLNNTHDFPAVTLMRRQRSTVGLVEVIAYSSGT
jgi:hypothetical protein